MMDAMAVCVEHGFWLGWEAGGLITGALVYFAMRSC